MTEEPLVNEQAKKNQELTNIVRTILSAPQEEEMACEDCYDVIDQYVDMLRAGQDPETVLPKVKEHLSQCDCCDVEFHALISILEAATGNPPEDDVVL